MPYDIYFADLDETKILQLPLPPTNMPELSKTFKNQEFEVWGDGLNVNVLGNPSLVTFSLSGILPGYAGKYNYARSQINPYDMINLWSSQATAHKPLRCVMTRPDKSSILSWRVTVEAMNWYEEKNGDVNYKVDFKQYAIDSLTVSDIESAIFKKQKEKLQEAFHSLMESLKFLSS